MNDVEWCDSFGSLVEIASEWREVALQLADAMQGVYPPEKGYYLRRRALDNFNRLNEKYPKP
jgi:hypothetical protein